MTAPPELAQVSAQGSAWQIGHALGLAGRAAVHKVLLQAPYWAAVTAPEHRATVARLGAATRVRFPAIWEELQGLAAGLDVPFSDILAWNCRGDLLSNTGDGCTSVQIPDIYPIIAHNEDGLPGFRGHAFLAQVQPQDAPGFTAFCYPGSVPGHTFAVTRAGLVQAVNNIRLTGIDPHIPRMVLARAVLGCRSLDAACALLADDPRSGGFHMSFAQVGDPRMLSVEYGNGAVSVQEIQDPSTHANHALHLGAAQRITQSSANRQARGDAFLAQGQRDPRAILRDTGGAGLPIFRTHPDDPDDENTLATAMCHLSAQGVRLTVLDQSGAEICLDIPCDQGGE